MLAALRPEHGFGALKEAEARTDQDTAIAGEGGPQRVESAIAPREARGGAYSLGRRQGRRSTDVD